jgi:multisubunit Na+/H+ antiporter MnhB subunit
MRRSTILDVCVRAEFHTLVLISLFLLFAGHNAPGGGFIGGLVAGAALALRFLAGGAPEIRVAVRVHPFVFLGTGLLLAALTAVTPLLVGDNVLESALTTFDVPAVGEVKVTSSLVFDIGVYLVVFGLVFLLLEALGAGVEEPSVDAAAAPEPEATP